LGFHGFPDSSLASGAISVVDGGATFPNGPNLSPPDDVGTAGTSHTVTAAVFSYRDDLLPGIQVLFSVQGSVNTTGACTTDSSGQCSFTYQGPGFPGADLITACSDANHNGIVDEDERCTTTTQAWVLPTTTAGHITGGGQVLDASGSDYDAFGFTAQSDNSGIKGECTMVDPAASVKIKCLDVTTVSKSGTHATLFGDATVNGTPTTYRIDVDDLGEPGTGNDTFKLQTASGYTAGGVIQSGNIQIH
jgi:hypothetical protein